MHKPVFNRLCVAVGLFLAACGNAATNTNPVTPAITPTLASTPHIVVTLMPTPTEAITATAIPADTPATVATSTVLPVPLYFLAASAMPTNTLEQIWRLEIDGTTLTQITNEFSQILDYAVSPKDSSVIYVSASNQLIKTGPLGQNRTVLIEGPQLTQSDVDNLVVKQIRNVSFSADGSQISYGLNGINLIGTDGGESKVIKPSDPLPEPGQPLSGAVKLYWPLSFSPDGARMLVEIGHYPGEITIALMDLADGHITQIAGEDMPQCCNPNWSADGQFLTIANPMPGMYSTGLWRIDAATGQTIRLIGSTNPTAPFQLVSHAFPAADGEIYYFFGEGDFSSVAPRPTLQMHALGKAPLRTDANKMAEALWIPQPTPLGAVVVDGSQATQYPFSGPLIYLKRDGSAAIPLVDKPARMLRWGV